jgi:thiamine biosynthesis lipoprotein
MLGFLLFFIRCADIENQYTISGNTMGTTYLVKIITPNNNYEIESIEKSIDSLLIQLNKQMSTWDPESEISQFNNWNSKVPFAVSDDFLNVVKKSITISKNTGGLFDPTVFDLMSLWGFGPNPRSGFPDMEDVNRVLEHTGIGQIEITDSVLVKRNKRCKLDLNAIAKGYGVDKTFNLLNQKGFKNIFVEIGGEVKCSGKNIKNKNWSIGIEDPSDDGNYEKKISAIISVPNGAIATSGNYRNIVDLDGEILGHTINPQTGFPIQTDVLSVSVLSNSCMESDAWATALMAMNHQTGFALVENQSNINAVWILVDNYDGKRYFSMSGDIDIKKMIYPLM